MTGIDRQRREHREDALVEVLLHQLPRVGVELIVGQDA